VNCAEINIDRPRQAAYEIFSIERRFQQFKSRPSRFKKTFSTEGHQRAVPPKSHYFTVKTVADMHEYAAYHNKH